MSKIERVGGNLEAFASAALSDERTLFGQTGASDGLTQQLTDQFKRGWGIVGPNAAPTLQDFNALGFTTTQILAYLHQMGVPEWDAAQAYQVGSIANFGGKLYSCKTANHAGATDPEADTVNWQIAGLDDFVGLAGDQTIAGVKTFSSSPEVPNATTSQQAAAFGQIAGAFTGSSNVSLTANGWQRLPSGLVIQWGRFSVTFSTAPQTVSATINYPISFPNLHMAGYLASLTSAPNSYPTPGFVSSGNSQFIAFCPGLENNASQAYFYLAIGN